MTAIGIIFMISSLAGPTIPNRSSLIIKEPISPDVSSKLNRLKSAFEKININLVLSSNAPKTTKTLPKIITGKVLLKEIVLNSKSKNDKAKGTQIPKNIIGPKYWVIVQIDGSHSENHDKMNRNTKATNENKLINLNVIEIFLNLFSEVL